jgi:hypothetical protein
MRNLRLSSREMRMGRCRVERASFGLPPRCFRDHAGEVVIKMGDCIVAVGRAPRFSILGNTVPAQAFEKY